MGRVERRFGWSWQWELYCGMSTQRLGKPHHFQYQVFRFRTDDDRYYTVEDAGTTTHYRASCRSRRGHRVAGAGSETCITCVKRVLALAANGKLDSRCST